MRRGEHTPMADDAGSHVVDRLVEYFDGSLPAAEDVAVESHLLECAACRAEFDDLGAIALALTESGVVERADGDPQRPQGVKGP